MKTGGASPTTRAPNNKKLNKKTLKIINKVAL
jgi:hypothetical protein